MKKPRLIDRLLTVCLCFELALAFWWLYSGFNYQNQILIGVS
jgi:hypothetical protein